MIISKGVVQFFLKRGNELSLMPNQSRALNHRNFGRWDRRCSLRKFTFRFQQTLLGYVNLHWLLDRGLVSLQWQCLLWVCSKKCGGIALPARSVRADWAASLRGGTFCSPRKRLNLVVTRSSDQSNRLLPPKIWALWFFQGRQAILLVRILRAESGANCASAGCGPQRSWTYVAFDLLVFYAKVWHKI